MSRVETLVSFFGDRRARTVPAAPAEPVLTPEQLALVAEACAKSGVVWIRPVEEERKRLAWHVWHEDAVHVVYGVGEQVLPLLSGLAEVDVPSKDTRARLVSFLARAQVLSPRSPEWEAAAAALTAARLNAHDPATQHERWATGALITRLVPLQLSGTWVGADTAGSQAAEPQRTAWTTTTRTPWHLGGRRGRAHRRAVQDDEA